MPTLFGEKIVLRLLDQSNLKLDLAQLGFEEDHLNLFREALNQPQGMILITGPTGSGKTTTIYSALYALNQPEVNISTAEDPVEYNLEGIIQVPVNPSAGFTFAEALRAFLRQDPEVIMVGEIRDQETAGIAYKAASTGHLVVSTLHTNDAASTVFRLVEIGVEPYVIAEATSVIVSQRLIGKICPQCAQPAPLSEQVLAELGIVPDAFKYFMNIKKGMGCAACNGLGVKGRLPVFEVMKMTPGIKRAIYQRASPAEIKARAVEDGMRTLRQSALLKLRQGLTSLTEVLNTTAADV